MKRSGSILHLPGFCLFYGLSRTMLLLPLAVLYLVSDLLFLLAYYFPGYRKRVVLENLNNSFPGRSPKEINKIARGYYRHMCDSLIESFAASVMSEKEIRKRCVWKNAALLDKYYDQGKSVVAVFGHYGNWEWLFSLPLYTRYKVLALYRPLTNSYFDRFMKRLRERFGISAIPVNNGYHSIIRHRQQDIRTITFFLGDHRPAKKDIRYWTKFLNQDTPVMLGSEKIARNLDQVVVFFDMKKVKRGYYEVEIIPLSEKPSSTGQYEITELHTRSLEAQINQNPEYWLWSHKRWKHKRTEIPA